VNNFLTIELNPTKDVHGDLLLSIPSIGVECLADSYFLIGDKYLQTNKEGYEKVAEVLIHILLGWKSKIEALKNQSTCFLPFDFSDEYIGCLRLQLIEKDTLNLHFGFSQKIPGFGINPSDVESFDIEDSDFIKDNEVGEITVDKVTLLNSIDVSIRNIKLNFIHDIEKK